MPKAKLQNQRATCALLENTTIRSGKLRVNPVQQGTTQTSRTLMGARRAQKENIKARVARQRARIANLENTTAKQVGQRVKIVLQGTTIHTTQHMGARLVKKENTKAKLAKRAVSIVFTAQSVQK